MTDWVFIAGVFMVGMMSGYLLRAWLQRRRDTADDRNEVRR